MLSFICFMWVFSISTFAEILVTKDYTLLIKTLGIWTLKHLHINIPFWLISILYNTLKHVLLLI